MKKTPVTIVTGFLGSGKTTLVNKALRDPRLQRSVVIVNEFGDVGIDHDLIQASDDSVVLLPNGCLCCSVKSDLVSTLVDLHRKRAAGSIGAFDRVIVETSGLAEPSAVLEVISSDPGVAALYRAAGVVATVDAVNGGSTLDSHDTSLRQVAMADRILLTKTDLLGDAAAALALREQLIRINPAARLLEAAADTDPGATLYFEPGEAFPGRGELPEADPHGHTHDEHERIHRFSIVRDEPVPFETLRLFLEALNATAGPNLLRVKGLVNVAEHPDGPAVIHGSQLLIHKLEWLNYWPRDDRRTRIMFITLDTDHDSVAEIWSDIERLSQRTRRARERAGQS